MSAATLNPDSALRPRRPVSWWDRTWLRFLVAALIVAVLHVPFLLPMQDVQEKPAADPDAGRAGIVVLPAPPERGGGSPALDELYLWMALMDAADGYRPDWRHGFSALNRTERPEDRPVWPTWTQEPHRLGSVVFAPLKLSVMPANAAELLLAGWKEYTPTEPLVAWRRKPVPHEVVWRRGSGLPLRNPPSLDEATLKVWNAPETRGRLSDTTLLAVQTVPMLAPPRIVLRRSCGVPALDAGAVRAVRGVLQGLPPSDPERQPFSELTLEIEWRY